MKNYIKIATFIIIFSVAAVFSVSADIKPKKPDYVKSDVYILRQAKLAYLSEDYGKAIELAAKAKIWRKNEIDWEIYTLQNSLKSSEVKKAGNVLSAIVPVLQKRQEYDSIEIISRYQKIRPAGFFHDSASELIDYISKRSQYPEADWLTGNIYKIDGEYKLSEQYLTAAWNNAFLLDIPDEQYDILYSLADLYYLENDLNNYEINLLLILSDDSAFKNKDKNNAMLMILSNAHPGTMEKFFNRFRSTDYKAIKAYQKLSDYYETAGETEKALKASALASLTGFTKMYNVAKQRDPEFEYQNMASFLSEIQKYDDVTKWASENDIWETFVTFARKAKVQGDETFSSEFLTALSQSLPDDYWKGQALKDLQNN